MATKQSGKQARGELGMAAGAIGALVLVALGYLVFQNMRAPEPVANPTPEPSPISQPVAETPVAEMPVAATPDAETPEVDTPAPAPDVQAEPGPVHPSFDLVRIEADGSAVIAGLAAPGADVHVVIDGKDVSIVQADASGNFVALLDILPSDQPRVVSLEAVDVGGTRLLSRNTAIIQPVEAIIVAEVEGEVPVVQPPKTEPDEPENIPETANPIDANVAEAEPAASTSEIARPAPPATNDLAELPTNVEQQVPDPVAVVTSNQTLTVSPETTTPKIETVTDMASPEIETPKVTSPMVPIPAVIAAPEETSTPVTPVPSHPAPPRILMAAPDGIIVVQDGGVGPAALEQVTLDTITYDAAGEVQLSGRGTGASSVQVYLDNRPVLTAQIAEDGQWRTPLPEVESGVYTLRIDEIRADGSVASRIETPFQREDVEQLASVASEIAQSTTATPSVRAVTVQPGSTLWAIARDKWGDGALYVRVFEANRDQIRNADLIYPGQVFAVPDE